MSNVPWWVQAICAGITTAAPMALLVEEWNANRIIQTAWMMASGFATYIVGKFQLSPFQTQEKEKKDDA